MSPAVRMPPSTTSQPPPASAAETALFSMADEVRGSLPTSTAPSPAKVAKADAKSLAAPGVSPVPTTPRMPEAPRVSSRVLSSCMMTLSSHMVSPVNIACRKRFSKWPPRKTLRAGPRADAPACRKIENFCGAGVKNRNPRCILRKFPFHRKQPRKENQHELSVSVLA